MKLADRRLGHRARVLFSLVLVGLAALVGRAGYMQVVRGDEYHARAVRQHFDVLEVPAPRGRIVDRNGRILAASYHARSVALDPSRVEDPGLTASRLAMLLDEPAEPLRRRIAEAREAGRRFLYVRRRVDRGLAARIEASGIAGLDLREEPRREYPQGRAGAAVIGVTGEREDAPGRTGGLTGLEAHCDAMLRGVPGERLVLRAGGREREALHLFPDRRVEPRPGRDVATTLHAGLQQVVEEALDGLQAEFSPKGCAAVAIDPRNGEILALAGRPGFSPDRFPDVDRAALALPAVQSVFEPGSTIKPLVLAWALTHGAVHAGQRIECGDGAMRFGGRTLHDVHGYGELSLLDVVVKSSNIGMAQVGRALGVDATYDLLGRVGFGRPTGVELSGEQSGIVTPRERWHPDYTLVSVSMGHEIAVTPLQLAAAIASLVNGGWMHRPTLLKDARRPAPRRVGYEPHALELVRETMVRVVEEGTGRAARVPGVAVGGKTGTSDKYGEPKGRVVASFVGFAPAEAPRLVVVVTADEPVCRDGRRPYGGVVAAPAVGRILARGLPLLEKTPSGSGFRETSEELVRVAAIRLSSVCDGERISPESSRNPGSEGVACRRDDR